MPLYKIQENWKKDGERKIERQKDKKTERKRQKQRGTGIPDSQHGDLSFQRAWLLIELVGQRRHTIVDAQLVQVYYEMLKGSGCSNGLTMTYWEEKLASDFRSLFLNFNLKLFVCIRTVVDSNMEKPLIRLNIELWIVKEKKSDYLLHQRYNLNEVENGTTRS